MKIIPAIDIIDGKCVRLSKGDFSTQKVYNQNPLEVAKEFEDYGIKYLHLVDLDGAKAQQPVNYKVLEKIATKTSLQIDFGGGIKTLDDVQLAFDSGANQITIGSMAVQNRELAYRIIHQFGAERIILGADFLNRKVKTSGWLEESNIDVIDFLKQYQTKGIKQAICTDISKDGMLEGASEQLYQEIIEKTEIDLIASGGISSIEDLHTMQRIGCYGTILGKAIYEGRINLQQIASFNR